jgi:hypothetical protein
MVVLTYVSADPQFGKKFTIISFVILSVVIIFSTYLHYAKQEGLHIPSMSWDGNDDR